jgi:hypothetical protein
MLESQSSITRGRRGRHHRVRHQFRRGERLAVIRAMTAAKLYMDKSVPTLAAAATSCGSNVPYVRAGVALIKTENIILAGRATRGHVSLLKAAREARRLGDLLKAYRAADASDHVAFAKIVGPETMFNNMNLRSDHLGAVRKGGAISNRCPPRS